MTTTIVDPGLPVPDVDVDVADLAATDPSQPPKDYRDAVFRAVEKREPTAAKLKKLLHANGRSKLAWKCDVETYRTRRHGAGLLATSRRLFAQADELQRVANAEQAEFAKKHPPALDGAGCLDVLRSPDADRASKMFRDAIDIRNKAWRLLGHPAAPNAEPTARGDLVQSYLSTMQRTGPLDAERREILGRHGRDFGKALGTIREEIERVEGVIDRFLDGRPPLRGEMPSWRQESAGWSPGPEKTEAANEPDQRDPAVILRELQDHLADCKRQRACILADRDRANTLLAEIDGLRQQAQRTLRELLDPKTGMRWSDL